MCGRATCANLMGVNHEKNDQFYVWWGLYVSCRGCRATQNSFCEPPSPSISKLIGLTFCPNSLNDRSLDLDTLTDGLPSTAEKGSRLVPRHNALTITPFAESTWSNTPTRLPTDHLDCVDNSNNQGLLRMQIPTAKSLGGAVRCVSSTRSQLVGFLSLPRFRPKYYFTPWVKE